MKEILLWITSVARVQLTSVPNVMNPLNAISALVKTRVGVLN
ncbi:hypothetical protein VCRA2119O147_80052 [Vibrio crassostreae]|nr:hypothetical protein VCRA2113O202_120052 [Vibrio crassostreae]CAK1738431.1 hypothetical protein VCRA2113O193_120103 [Vibrio crassostreae]CAK1744454.1 hypothetical protein VCRA2119O245_130052 [Vibrio crassostreae]CAK1748033.1 hypothetical protein VCRA2112O184_130052 [Vibrio crassostreae]CAK1752521.1 hypothetical protein VCRA2113O207_140052 [Vibrio crassostreae]